MRAASTIPGRFVLWFVAVLGAGMAISAALAVFVDPLHQFGTGKIPSILTGERDEKPALFLAASPVPTAIVLGSSKVMKLDPKCIGELTGLVAFNFGLSDSLVEDWIAAFHFARAHATLRELVIGIDPEAFDNHAEIDARLTSSTYLSPYIPGAVKRSWTATARALFGWQAFRYALLSLRYALQPSKRPHQNYTFDHDGYLTYSVWEPELAQGVLPRSTMVADMRRRLEGPLARSMFTELEPHRVELFVSLVREAHDSGIHIDAFIPPIEPDLAEVVRTKSVGRRLADLDELLGKLDGEGVLHYARIGSVADFHGDPNGFFDGVHMFAANTNRLLVSVFHATSGCGIE